MCPSWGILIREWTAYVRAALRVRAQARAEGKDWPFVTDPAILLKFLFLPHQLFEDGDSSAVRMAKRQLIVLRNRVHKTFGLAIMLALLGFLAAIVYSIAAGFLTTEV